MTQEWRKVWRKSDAHNNLYQTEKASPSFHSSLTKAQISG